jgi:hypothetical protein
MIYKTLHGKLNIVQLESHSKKGRVEYRCSERVSSSYSTSGTPYITHCQIIENKRNKYINVKKIDILK